MTVDSGNLLFLILQAISTICFFFGIYIINGFRSSLDKIQNSIGNLNISITKLVEKDLSKDQRLDDHRALMDRMEKDILQLRERYHDYINSHGSKVELIFMEVETLKKTVDDFKST
jgi:peptidoglycan hydrolase CwlO-like protein